MLAFGMGTLPTMLGIGISTSLLSQDRRSQLFRLGGWVTLTIGILTLLRTGDVMIDYTGHGALILLFLALIARPVSGLWVSPLRYRRALGVGAFVLSGFHTIHMIEHSLQWNLAAFWFLTPLFQWGMAAGVCGFILMVPAAVTSFDSWQKRLGKRWRQIHLLGLPAIVFSVIHALTIGSHYFGSSQLTWENKLAVGFLLIAAVAVFLLRNRFFWSLLSLEKFYVPPSKAK